MIHHIKIYQFILIIALFFAIYRKEWKKDSLPFFFIFLIIVNIVENILGPIAAAYYKSNFFVYNLFIIITVQYYCFLFYSHFKKYSWANKIIYISLFLCLFSLLNYFFIQGMHVINTLSYNISMIFVIILILIYFNDLIRNVGDNNLFYKPLFLLSIGILLFYTASFPYLVFLNKIAQLGTGLDRQLYSLVKIGNIFLSLSYIAVLLCPWISKKQSIELS